jgi:ABC-2 type transport system permease protein
MWAVSNFSRFVRYPLSAYHKAVRFIVTWVLPYGAVTVYPAHLICGRGDVWTWLATPAAGAAVCLLAYRLWLAGLRRFEGVGS